MLDVRRFLTSAKDTVLRHTITLFLVLALVAACGSRSASALYGAQSAFDSGIVYGKDHAFAVSAPSGWVLDNESGVSQGLHAVFYPTGSSWREARTVMYANTVHKADSGRGSRDAVIAGDIQDFTGRGRGAAVRDAESLTTADGKAAILKLFHDRDAGNFEVVAYIDEPNVVVMLVLSARSEKERDLATPAFQRLVGSYHFVTGDVVLPKPNGAPN